MNKLLLAGTVASVIVCASDAPSSAQNRKVQAGTLACDVAPTVGLILGSQQQLTCVYRSRTTGLRDAYTGTITRVGLDIGVTAGGKLLWAVYAPSKGLGARPLAGTYVGASGDVSVGMGAGGNVLLGGSNRSVSLQPLSIKGQAGANLAVGIASLNLQ